MRVMYEYMSAKFLPKNVAYHQDVDIICLKQTSANSYSTVPVIARYKTARLTVISDVFYTDQIGAPSALLTNIIETCSTLRKEEL